MLHLKHMGQRLNRQEHQPALSKRQLHGDADMVRSSPNREAYSTSSTAKAGTGAELDNWKDRRLWRSWEVLPRLLRKGLSDRQRLEVLRALGSCENVKVADTFQMHTPGNDCNLSLAEWEALLVPLKSNPSLEEIHIWLPGKPPETWRIIGQYWKEVVENAPALKKLSVSVHGLRSCKDIPVSEGTDFQSDASIRFRLPFVLEQLASGLRGNPNPALEELNVEFGDGASSDTVHHVVEMLECPLKKLRVLSLVDVPRLGGSEKQALSNALKQCTSLCTLEIKGAKEGMTEVLLQTYGGSGSSQTILKKLILRGPCIAGLGPALPHLLVAHINHLLMDMSDFVWWPGDDRGFRDLVNFPWEEIGSALLRTVCLQSLTFLLECRGPVLGLLRKQIETCMEGLKEVWEASRQSPLFCISLNWDVLDFHKYQNYADVLSYVDVLIKALSLLGLKQVRIVLDVYNSCELEALLRVTKSVMDTLNRNECIETCSLGFNCNQLVGGRYGMNIPQIRSLLVDNLRYNTSIKHLVLESSFFQCSTEQVFRGVMKLLTENFALQQIDVESKEWKLDGKAALVQEAVDRNAENAKEISVFRDARLKFATTNAGRILLCGARYAGKTRLKKTMVHAAKTDALGNWRVDFKSGTVSSSIRSALDFDIFRTEGTDIATLRDEEDMHLSLWDIGERKTFRALEELLFPKTGPPCLFLFIFNPTEVVHGLRRKKVNVESSFQKELKSWIRFLASNCAVTVASPPQMMVVLSHKDKMGRSETDLKWAKVIVNQLRINFKGVVDLVGEFEGQDIQLVNCFDAGDVRTLNESIFKRMRLVFDKLMSKHLVPRPGIDMTRVFARKPKEIWGKPIWRTHELHRYFREQHEALYDLDPETPSGVTILQAVARYLHDVGSILMIPKSDLVVVDPSWMAKFLRMLISEGTCFQTGRTTRSPEANDGFLGLSRVCDIVSRLKERYNKEDIEIDSSQLRELLIRLELCFRLDSGDDVHSYGHSRSFFMPAIVGEPDEAPARRLRWMQPCSSSIGSQDFGFRLQCKDREKTCLQTSFFPKFQIGLRKMLVQRLKMNEENVWCSGGVMEIREDGSQIFVECDGLGEDHIDIMVRSASPCYRRKEKARRFIQNHIIKFLVDPSSASEMGCSGISWSSLYILRTECVTKLTSREYRGDEQAISEEELKEKLRDVAQLQLGYTRNRSEKHMSMDDWIDSCLQYKQSWPEIKDADGTVVLPAGIELGRELLSARDLREIRKELKYTVWNSGVSGRTHERQVIKLNDQVYEIYSPLQHDPLVELVFFHGVLEHESDEKSYLTAWSTRNREDPKDRSVCWLNTWLVSHDVDLKLARVLTLSYDSSMRKTDSTGRVDIYLLAENLTLDLIIEGRVGQHNCPVVLVGHCLGGLVIKEVCNQAFRRIEIGSHRDHYANFLDSVKGMFFYATPHLGFSSNLVDRQQSVPRYSSSAAVSSTIYEEKGGLIKSVELLDERSSRVNYHFDEITKKYKWKTCGVGESDPTTFPMDKDTFISQIVVTEASARAECTSFAVIPHTDHFTICRPESVTSDNFTHLVHFVKGILQEGW